MTAYHASPYPSVAAIRTKCLPFSNSRTPTTPKYAAVRKPDGAGVRATHSLTEPEDVAAPGNIILERPGADCQTRRSLIPTDLLYDTPASGTSRPQRGRKAEHHRLGRKRHSVRWTTGERSGTLP